MFDTVRNNKRVVQIFLALIALPFAFWGVDSYVRNTGAGDDLASVGDSKITMPQFEQAQRAQQERMRQVLGPAFRAEMMNTPEARQSVLTALIDQRLLLLEATKGRLLASDEMVREVIGRIPALHENGKFSMDRYKAVLSAQGMSQAQFEMQIRQDLTLQQVVNAVGEGGIASRALSDTLWRIESEQREVAEFRISAEQFAAQTRIDPAAIEKFYQENPRQFEVPEQAKAAYLVLSLDALLAQATVSEAEVGAWYAGHKERYQQPEERRASHILFQTNAEGGAEKAKSKAEQVLAEVQKAPDRFAELARTHSQDPGSADKGGDLGFFGRGMMVKAFEDSVFQLKENEISGLVQSDFGYHIIKLTGIKPGKERPLAEVRAEIENELKRQTAARQFAEAAEAFSNTVYEQADSLQPTADKFKLAIQHSDWLLRNAPPETAKQLGPVGHPKVLAALFSDDALKNKRNTEVVEVAPNTLLAARVVDYQPARSKPLESVKGEISAALLAKETAALARKEGESKLRELQQGGADKLAWAPARTLSRGESHPLPRAAAKAVFQTSVAKLPAYTGVEADGGGYSLYRITKVNRPDQVDENRRQALQKEVATLLAREDFAAYLAGLRLRYKVDINQAALASKER